MTPARIVDAVLALDALSDLPRTGWLLRGITPCESIAAHSYSVAVLTGMIVDRLRIEGLEVDGERALRLALLHDAAEARTGDVPMPAKSPELRAAMRSAERRLVHGMLPASMASHFDEAALGETLEARIVRSADKLQMLCKALRYQQQGWQGLDEFFAAASVRDEGIEPVRALYAEVFRRAGRELP